MSVPFRFYIFDLFPMVNTLMSTEFNGVDENLIEEIIGSLDPDLLPWIYIDLAFITGLDGIEREVTGSELYSLLNHPSLDKVALSVQVLMDRKKLKQDIVNAISEFWDDVLRQGEQLDDDDHEE